MNNIDQMAKEYDNTLYDMDPNSAVIESNFANIELNNPNYAAIAIWTKIKHIQAVKKGKKDRANNVLEYNNLNDIEKIRC